MYCPVHTPHVTTECWLRSSNHTQDDTLGNGCFVLHLGVYFDSLDAPHRSQSGELSSLHTPNNNNNKKKRTSKKRIQPLASHHQHERDGKLRFARPLFYAESATKMPAVPFPRWQRQGPYLILRVRWRQCSSFPNPKTGAKSQTSHCIRHLHSLNRQGTAYRSGDLNFDKKKRGKKKGNDDDNTQHKC